MPLNIHFHTKRQVYKKWVSWICLSLLFVFYFLRIAEANAEGRSHGIVFARIGYSKSTWLNLMERKLWNMYRAVCEKNFSCYPLRFASLLASSFHSIFLARSQRLNEKRQYQRKLPGNTSAKSSRNHSKLWESCITVNKTTERLHWQINRKHRIRGNPEVPNHYIVAANKVWNKSLLNAVSSTCWDVKGNDYIGAQSSMKVTWQTEDTVPMGRVEDELRSHSKHSNPAYAHGECPVV